MLVGASHDCVAKIRFQLYRVAVERRGGADPVADHQRPEGLDDVTAAVRVAAELQRRQVVRDHLALGRPPLAEEVPRHHAADQLILPQVAEPQLQVQRAVPHGDQRVAGEDHRGAAPCGLCELGEEDTSHASLHW